MVTLIELAGAIPDGAAPEHGGLGKEEILDSFIFEDWEKMDAGTFVRINVSNRHHLVSFHFEKIDASYQDVAIRFQEDRDRGLQSIW